MAKNKTATTTASVTEFIDNVDNEVKRNDSYRLVDIYKEVSGFEPKMWGPTIIGFGSYHYQYESGHSGDAPVAGFSPRKPAIVLYFASDFKDRQALLEKLGKHTSSKACVYVKKLSEIDEQVLKEMIRNSIEDTFSKYPS